MSLIDWGLVIDAGMTVGFLAFAAYVFLADQDRDRS
jgi:hypothetical protein